MIAEERAHCDEPREKSKMFGLRFTNYLVQHICPTIWVHPLAVIPDALSYNNQQAAEAEEK